MPRVPRFYVIPLLHDLANIIPKIIKQVSLEYDLEI